MCWVHFVHGRVHGLLQGDGCKLLEGETGTVGSETLERILSVEDPNWPDDSKQMGESTEASERFIFDWQCDNFENGNSVAIDDRPLDAGK
jgi:hypothetical protein